MVYFLFRRRTSFLLIASIILLFAANTTPKSFWIGLPIVIIGEAIRIWSAGYLSKMSRLITAGPFAIGRNPLYIGSFLISVGYFIMCNQPAIWVLGPILFWLFHGGAITYEEKMLAEKFGDDFKKYCATVPRLISIPHSLAGHGEFSMGQLILNREHKSMTGTALVIGLFAILAFHSIHMMPIVWLVSRLR